MLPQRESCKYVSVGNCSPHIIFILSLCTQQEKVIAEIKSHSNSSYDSQSVQFLEALNQIFENGLLSKEKVINDDSHPLRNMQDGLSFFTAWCDECIKEGENTYIYVIMYGISCIPCVYTLFRTHPCFVYCTYIHVCT